FGGCEVLRGTLFTGFPWLLASCAFAFWPAWIQAASLVGAYALSALYAAPACLFGAALAPPGGSGKKRLAAALLGIFLLFLPPAYGRYRLAGFEDGPAPDAPDTAPPIKIILIQGNVDQNQKWEPLFQKSTLDLYLDLSRKALEDEGRLSPEPVSLVVWPETAMPFAYPMYREYALELSRFAVAENINLAFGALGVEHEFGRRERLYNRLFLLSPQGRRAGDYDKRHLVPFGEYTPFAANIPYLSDILQGMDFSAGTTARLLPLSPPAAKAPVAGETRESSAHTPALSLGPLICYEAIFPGLAQAQVEAGADILLNVSNDGWFRKSSAPYQHLSHAVLRAVEQARPLARATNTGISAVIDASGRITERLEGLFVTGTLTARVRASSGLTPYHRLYPLPEILLVITVFCALLGPVLLRNKD
ncbi:MAG: apolipoprotein N-acyltransferase, partial [Desulfovibrio sp.]|nr:apolipoprotein N-acyltransferase [Desulfovibrio sp.]